MGPTHSVWAILDHRQPRSLDQLGGSLSRCRKRHNSIGIPVNYQRGYIDASYILAEVFMPGRHAGNTGRRRSARGNIPARLDCLFADALTQQDISVVDILEKLDQESRAVRGNRFLHIIEP